MDSSESIINQRKEKIIGFLKTKLNWVIWTLLSVIIFIAIWIRTRNLSGLRDITTGGWTLGPDLDPFLFLRYAKDIVEQGTLYAIDMFRYSPVGIPTDSGYPFYYYSIVWFHDFASFFGSNSIEQSSALYPVFMFALTAIAFFLLSRKILIDKLSEPYASIGALISTFFLSTFSVFIPRTIAGIPEKESAAFLFMFLAIYLFICSWESITFRKRLTYGALAGISTATMALIWGAYAYLFFIIVPTVFLSFLIGNMDMKHIWSYGSWFISASVIMIISSSKYPFITTFTSLDRGIALITLLSILFYQFVYLKKINNFVSKRDYRLSPRLLSSIICIVGILVIGTLVLGPVFMFNRFAEVYDNFVRPATSRLIQTVAENRQPYLTEWISSFGPNVRGIFITFWLFLIGSALILWRASRELPKKQRVALLGAYILMILMITFTRYSESSKLNGSNTISLILYVGGIFLFLFTFMRISYIDEKENRNGLKQFSIGLLLFFMFLFVSLISARGFIRLVMIVVPPASIALGYIFASTSQTGIKSIKNKSSLLSIIIAIIILVSVIYSANFSAKESLAIAREYVPSVYTQQWQKAMSWVRDNTPREAVFAHWWDYGYWIQSIGERATVLDGGNDISFWNHLMGRYALTESDFTKTLAFLYAHKTTHFLIDSSDIGKYGAFSSIGSDATRDRQSWIPSFVKDPAQKQQRKNSTTEVYISGTHLDQDIIYNDNNTEIFLPSGATILGAILIDSDNNGTINSLQGYFVYGGKNYMIPLKYYYDSYGRKIEFEKGVDAGVFVYSRINLQTNGQAEIDRNGALLYLSPRTIHTNLVNYYLIAHNQNKYFKLAHTESDAIIETLRTQNVEIGEFAYFNGFRGPIKIWTVSYPENIKVEEKYLETAYPDSIRLA